jgi:hypothetical protein
MHLKISDSRLVAVWLLTLAVFSPAAAGSVEPVREPVGLQAAASASSTQTLRVADKSAAQTDVTANASASARRAADKRDSRLNDDLAAFRRAF